MSQETQSYFITVSRRVEVCVNLFIPISTAWYQRASHSLPVPLSCCDTPPNPPSLLPSFSVSSELIKRGFNMSLPFLFTPKQSHETVGEGGLIGVGGCRGHGTWAGAFHLPRCGNYLLLFLLCVSKSLMSPWKVALHANVGVVCVFFFPPSFLPCHLPLKAIWTRHHRQVCSTWLPQPPYK